MAAIREIITGSPDELAGEFESINVDRGGIGIMSPKAFFHVLRLRELKSPAANILKQEMLALGGECATSKTVILGDPQRWDVILMGTRRQLARLAKKLKAQPFGLKTAAGRIDVFLREASGNNDARPVPPLDRLHPDGDATQPLLMGVLNITPDSFSDGGDFLDADRAVVHGREMLAAGADLLDVGGESTRPGSDPVSVAEELRRVLPVIERLAEVTDRPISIDTMKAEVARRALEAGAGLVNDVSAGRQDPAILGVVADAGCPCVLMHMQGVPKTMQEKPHYDLVMDALHRFFDERLAAAVKRGVREEQIVIDPGIGFGKRREDNYEILRRLRELRVFGRPVLVGLSRKSFLQNEWGQAPKDRLEETIAAQSIAMANGADILRVHDILPAVKSRIVIQRLIPRGSRRMDPT